MRAIWKGAVSFGLVNVPVKVYAATGEKDVRFHQVHKEDGGRIRYKRVCSVDGEEVAYSDIAKGFETDDGELVVLTDEDFAELPLTSSREIDVVEFVPSEQVDPIMYAKAYYLEPERTAAKPYALLRQALEDTDRVAVVKVALRQREALAVLRVRENVILLQTLLWPDEVRAADFDVLDSDVDLRPQEVAMASSLVEQLAADFDPEAFTDEYTEALRSVIDAKIGSGEVTAPPAAEQPEGEGAEVVDLLTALQRSVDRARSGRGGGDAAAGGRAAGSAAGAGASGAEESGAEESEAGASAAEEPPQRSSSRTAASGTSRASTAKRASGKRASGKTASGGQPAGKQTAAKKPPAKKTAAKQTAAKQTAAKKTPAKQAAAKKSGAAKGAARKQSPRKSA